MFLSRRQYFKVSAGTINAVAIAHKVICLQLLAFRSEIDAPGLDMRDDQDGTR